MSGFIHERHQIVVTLTLGTIWLPNNWGKGIQFIVLYPPKCSHNPSKPVYTETILIPHRVFQSNWQLIAHSL